MLRTSAGAAARGHCPVAAARRIMHSSDGSREGRLGRRKKAMSEPRIIKKYPNRRLYDTVESRYITLSDIRRLVLDKVEFVVIDKKTQEDITRSILLQVISEQEHD